jgi:hypothetical protein
MKNRSLRNHLGAVAVAGFAVVGAGCNDISGGGWIPSANPATPTAKATFGFELTCIDSATGLKRDSAEGHLTYHDHGVTMMNGKRAVKLGIQAEVDRPEGGLFDICNETVPFGSFVGSYQPIPPTLGPGGTLYVYAEDGGDTGPSKGDILKIKLVGGVWDGYENIGLLGGGNITVGGDN